MAYVNLLKAAYRLGAIASVFVGSAALLTSPPAVAEGACPDIEVIFARGTNDAPGVGRVGQAFIDGLRPLVGGQTLTSYAVNYPASYDFLGSADGANDAAARIALMVGQCPSTKLVLGGYSQGAAVLDMLAGIPPLGNKLGGELTAPLDPSLVPYISAVAAFGNPSTKFSIPITSSVFGGRAIDLCKDGDPISTLR